MQQHLERVLAETCSKHPEVAGASVAVISNRTITAAAHGIASGFSSHEKENTNSTPLHTSTWLEVASLSKTVATAFSLDYLKSQNINPETSVNKVLESCGSTFRLTAPMRAGSFGEAWADKVQIKHLVNHTGLGMHYVFGVPLSREMPSVTELITDSRQARRYGYDAPLIVSKEPGTKFAYSGGGFLLLQHIVEMVGGGKSVAELTQPFLKAAGVNDNNDDEFGFSFDPNNREGVEYAHGFLDDGSLVTDTRLMFPAFAAGGLGTPAGLAQFLYHLGVAYNSPNGSGPVSHDTARAMLGDTYLVDLGASVFMNACVGLGVFVAQAGPNKVMLHQAANDGFRGVYVICFDGPAAANGPVGTVVLANGDNRAMFMNCGLVKHIMRDVLGLDKAQGFDWTRVEGKTFSIDGVSQEQIVNLGLKGLVFDAFMQGNDDAPTPSPSLSLSNPPKIQAVALTEAEFAPYGQIVQGPQSQTIGGSEAANQGTAQRFNWIAGLENNRSSVVGGDLRHSRKALPNVCVFRCQPRVLRPDNCFRVEVLERHEFSSQMFVPMTVKERWLVIVALGGDEPDMSTLKAFVAGRDQGMNFKAGVWHHPLVALDAACDIACLCWENGVDDDDCHIVDVCEADQVLVHVGEAGSVVGGGVGMCKL